MQDERSCSSRRRKVVFSFWGAKKCSIIRSITSPLLQVQSPSQNLENLQVILNPFYAIYGYLDGYNIETKCTLTHDHFFETSMPNENTTVTHKTANTDRTQLLLGKKQGTGENSEHRRRSSERMSQASKEGIKAA